MDVPLEATTLPCLSIAEDCFFYAVTVPFVGTSVILFLYQSIIVKPGVGHSKYKVVEDFLAEHNPVLITESLCRDRLMVGRKARMLAYLIPGVG